MIDIILERRDEGSIDSGERFIDLCFILVVSGERDKPCLTLSILQIILSMVRKNIAGFNPSDPLVARLGLGILEMAHYALRTKIIVSKEASPGFEFDRMYEHILHALLSCRKAKIDTIRLISDHKQKLAQNNIVRCHAGSFEVLETIDAPAKENIQSFIANGATAVRDIKQVLGLFGVDIECLFQDRGRFYEGIDKLYAANQHFLASYLKQARGFWIEKFFVRSSELEHRGWIMPDFTYKRLSAEKIEAVEPMIDGLSISDYSIIMLNRICGFIENILCHGIKQKLDRHEAVVEIPPPERNPRAPVRFKIVPRSEAVMEWDIRYAEDDF